MKANLPDFLSIARLILFFPLVMLAYMQRQEFVYVYLFALFTDIADGYIARMKKSASWHGKMLDIIADNFLAGSFLIAIYLTKPGIIIGFGTPLLGLILYSVLVHISVLIYAKKPLFMATTAGRVTAVLFPIAFLSLYFFGSGMFFYLFLFSQIFSLTEKLVISISDKKSLSSNIYFLIVSVTVLLGIIFLAARQDQVCFEKKCIYANIASTVEERQVGLMFRENMTDEEGMLFVFEYPGVYGFWMKNMKISIDMIFIGKNKKIVTIAKYAEPCHAEPCAIYRPDSDIQYVVEAAAGFSDKYGLDVGDRVLFDLK